MLRVAAYCRVSTDSDDQVNSYESQQRYFQECIRRNPDWVLQAIYADEGISGTSTRKRRQFNAMIAAARAGKIDLIITKEISRFARNTLDTLAYTRELRQRGVGVIFLLDNIDTRQQEGELRLTIMSSIAQEESRKTSQRVKWGQTRRMEQGVVFGGSLLGYDVAKGAITVNQEGARIVRRIFHQYLNEGKSAAVIAGELREEEVLSSRGQCRWSAATVLKILKNEKYCGDLVQKKTYTPSYLTHEKRYNRGEEALVVLREHHQPIIDRPVFEAVQRELRRRRRCASGSGGHGSSRPLSGKIRCGECGSAFLSRQKRTGSGEKYRVWRCGKATLEGRPHTTPQGHAGGCGIGRQLREDAALEILRQAVLSVPVDREAIARRLCALIADVCRDDGDSAVSEVRRLEREVGAAEEMKRRAIEEFLARRISHGDFRLISQSCDNRLAQLRQQLSAVRRQLGQQEDCGETAAAIGAALREIMEDRQGDSVFLGPLLDRMTIRSDGTAEVALRSLPQRWIFAL